MTTRRHVLTLDRSQAPCPYQSIRPVDFSTSGQCPQEDVSADSNETILRFGAIFFGEESAPLSTRC
jgi:hypothetical protein